MMRERFLEDQIRQPEFFVMMKASLNDIKQSLVLLLVISSLTCISKNDCSPTFFVFQLSYIVFLIIFIITTLTMYTVYLLKKRLDLIYMKVFTSLMFVYAINRSKNIFAWTCIALFFFSQESFCGVFGKDNQCLIFGIGYCISFIYSIAVAAISIYALVIFFILIYRRIHMLSISGFVNVDDQENTSSVNLIKEFIEKIKKIENIQPIIYGSLEVKYFTECSLCLSEFESRNEVKVLPCDIKFIHFRHYFHSLCIDQWLQYKGICPICRAEVLL